MEQAFLDKAAALRPRLHKTRVAPVGAVLLAADPAVVQGIRVDPDPAPAEERRMRCGDCMILDFGRHIVGTIRLELAAEGQPQDSPLRLRVTFGEMPCELLDYEYTGRLSSTWLGAEDVVIDCVERPYVHPRREAFRYVKIEMLGVHMHWELCVKKVTAIAQTAAGRPRPVRFRDPLLAKIDRIGCATLRDCMQTVYEDGPKRDRRLWLGDVHLEALANYETFGDRDLIRRCLYLFAGLPLEEGRMSCCIFEEPVLRTDPWKLWDYALFYISTLEDYYRATGDAETLRELWPTARRQAELVEKRIDAKGLIPDLSVFVDWQRGMDKTVSAHGIAVYAFRAAERLAKELSDPAEARFRADAERVGAAAIKAFYDQKIGLFRSGPQGEVSYASQVWMVLSGALDAERARGVLERVAAFPGALPMMTPYMHHYYVEALITAGLRNEALAHIRAYWGAMAEKGADCFWEAFDPTDDNFSPYACRELNSYCHAWSCTASYFLRKYFADL